jgi:hypothetical protein
MSISDSNVTVNFFQYSLSVQQIGICQIGVAGFFSTFGIFRMENPIYFPIAKKKVTVEHLGNGSGCANGKSSPKAKRDCVRRKCAVLELIYQNP